MQRSVANSGPMEWSARSNCPSQTLRSESLAHSDRMKLSAARVLLVEDDFIILLELETILTEAGAQIVGSCSSVEAALIVAMDGDINAALLDIRLGRQTIAPVARCLAQRDIPFAFYTAQTHMDSSLAE